VRGAALAAILLLGWGQAQGAGPRVQFLEGAGPCTHRSCEVTLDDDPTVVCRRPYSRDQELLFLVLTFEDGRRELRISPLWTLKDHAAPVSEGGKWDFKVTLPGSKSTLALKGKLTSDGIQTSYQEEYWVTHPVAGDYLVEGDRCRKLRGREIHGPEWRICEGLFGFYGRTELCAQSWFKDRCSGFDIVAYLCRDQWE
jgi:hypothetical protein